MTAFPPSLDPDSCWSRNDALRELQLASFYWLYYNTAVALPDHEQVPSYLHLLMITLIHCALTVSPVSGFTTRVSPSAGHQIEFTGLSTEKNLWTLEEYLSRLCRPSAREEVVHSPSELEPLPQPKL